MDFEVAPSTTGDAQAMASVLTDCVRYVGVNGPVLEDGDTLGGGDAAHIRVTHGRASWSDDTVYHLTLVGDAADGLEAVVCPACEWEVRGKVVRVRPVQMLEKCPACGAGPVALLQRMVDGLGGGRPSPAAAGRPILQEQVSPVSCVTI